MPVNSTPTLPTTAPTIVAFLTCWSIRSDLGVAVAAAAREEAAEASTDAAERPEDVADTGTGGAKAEEGGAKAAIRAARAREVRRRTMAVEKSMMKKQMDGCERKVSCFSLIKWGYRMDC